MSDVVLLPGAGLGSWIWDDVLPHLRARAVAVGLKPTIAENVALVRGKTVVAHSFAAQIAMAGAAKVILVGGVIQHSGRNFLSILPLPQRLLLGTYMRLSKTVKLPPSLVKQEYCNDLDEVTTELVLARVRPEHSRLYLDRVVWSGSAFAYVKLLNDQSAKPEQQDEMIRRVGATRVETLNTGHLPMLAKPRELAAILDRLIA